eukprot:TRINITY_DN47399_c0_g1_i1.p1 TRINITY_DN47399_c0_g1~~TRINITY_DN47399_c0_g1_i1.p1  ORF type:complete len:144 (+),score=16.15 TRINITY_DN47399_c0_g1_i1:41-472(+)
MESILCPKTFTFDGEAFIISYHVDKDKDVDTWNGYEAVELGHMDSTRSELSALLGLIKEHWERNFPGAKAAVIGEEFVSISFPVGYQTDFQEDEIETVFELAAESEAAAEYCCATQIPEILQRYSLPCEGMPVVETPPRDLGL